MNNVVFISYYFYPDMNATGQLATDLASEFRRNGLLVAVIRGKSLRLGRASLKGLILATLAGFTFILRALCLIPYYRLSYSSIILFSNPPFVSLLLPFIAALRFNSIFIEQDLFPWTLSLIFPGIRRKRAFKALKGLHHACLSCATSVVVLNDGMRKVLSMNPSLGRRLNVIRNWSVTEEDCLLAKSVLPSPAPYTDSSPFILGYSGNIGRAHDIPSLLSAVDGMSCGRSIILNISGTGYYRGLVEKHECSEDSRVRLSPLVPLEQLPARLRQTHAAIVSIDLGAEHLVAPSKLYALMACGVPVILVSRPSSDYSRLFKRHRLGLVVSPRNPTELRNAIYQLYDSPELLSIFSKNILCYYKAYYGRQISAYKYISLITRTSQ